LGERAEGWPGGDCATIQFRFWESNPVAIRRRTRSWNSAKNQQIPGEEAWWLEKACKALQKSTVAVRPQTTSHHFCAMFPAVRHLYQGTYASDRSWSGRENGRSLDLAIRQMFK
jgi:hypothetical protein